MKLKSGHAKKKNKISRYVYLRNQFREKKHTQFQYIESDLKSVTEHMGIVDNYNNVSEDVDIAKLEKKLRRYQDIERKLKNQLQKVREKINSINSQL